MLIEQKEGHLRNPGGHIILNSKILILKFLLIIGMIFLISRGQAQVSQLKNHPGIISGNLLDEKKKEVSESNIELIPFSDTVARKTTTTDKDGNFSFANIGFGYYRLKISYVGFKPLIIDSIHVRAERFDFNLPDILLKQISAQELEEVIVYAEKPIIQSKDGNITYNAAESALSAGSNASELLKNVPLVATDPTGKLTVRGKEPKVLIDDKPVELNAQQLQDFLESLPGSMIERIEVMTNPPPQYANEQGGVINIVTRRGRVGMGGRLNVYAGTRGELGISGNINYRKKGFAINFNAGSVYNRFEGEGYSRRLNIYSDSTNRFNTSSHYQNKNNRPNARLNMDYDFDARNSLNLMVQFNQNNFRNRSQTEYTNLDRFDEIYKLSDRVITSNGLSINPNLNLTFTHKGKQNGEVIKLITGGHYSYSRNSRLFFQQYLNPDHSPTGLDSTQQQVTNNRGAGYNVRLQYDKPLKNKHTFFSMGTFYTHSISHVVLDMQFLRKPDNVFFRNEELSNDFRFLQDINNIRFSVKHIFSDGISLTAGSSAEFTQIHFDLYMDKKEVHNQYWTLLPFANFNKNWKDVINLTFSYRRTIRRPGIGELNPSIDYADPYNIRFGNPYLQPSASHNFDMVVGRTKAKYYINLGMGYNIVQDVYSQIRTLQPDGKTHVTWQNIDDRMEYEVSTWSGYTLSKKMRINFSTSYTYNQYSLFDRISKKYRNGGSFTSNLNANFSAKDIWNLNGSFTFNRFANPQGTVKSSLSMNIGIQRKFFEKRFIITFNTIDPFIQQENRTFTYGTNFNHESFSTSRTRNFRLTLGYNFIRGAKARKK